MSCDPLCRRLLLTTSRSVAMVLSSDSGRCEKVAEGHGGQVIALLAHKTDPHAVFTLCNDSILRAWDVSLATLGEEGGEGLGEGALQAQLCGFLRLDNLPTAMVFLSPSKMLVAVTGADAEGNSASVLEIDVSTSSPSPSILYSPFLSYPHPYFSIVLTLTLLYLLPFPDLLLPCSIYPAS